MRKKEEIVTCLVTVNDEMNHDSAESEHLLKTD